ncbi:MAG: DUF4388 domain-containing protein [Desulfosarcinaceae bacterium]|nr:DUF4388 domain-containing protein [Desulfosarcinaceae bacterium]
MSYPFIDEILTANSTCIRELRNNKPILTGFLDLARQLDALPNLEKRFYEDPRSLYQATSIGRDLATLENIFKGFFGLPAKSSGRSLSLKMRRRPSVKHLDGVKKEQVFFLKPLEHGELYGALWPWHRKAGHIEVHLGYSAAGLGAADEENLRQLLNKALSLSALELAGDGVGGRLQGISLPSFLQMSEMEGATFALKVFSGQRSGVLHVREGNLIAAETRGIKGREAAYRIISWEQVAIQIADADPEVADEIQQPLMHVLMESLKIKDEQGDGTADPTPRQDGGPRPVAAPSGPVPATSDAISPEGLPAGTAAARPAAGKYPFERVVHPTPVEKGRKLSVTLVASILVCVLLLGTVGFFWGKSFMAKKRQANEYRDLIRAVTEEIDLEKNEKRLLAYLESRPESPFLADATAKLDAVRQAIEERDFERATLDVSNLPLDDTYEGRAIEIYSRFLTQYPDSRFKGEVNKAIGGIKILLDNTYYERLKNAEQLDFGKRLEAYQAYLSRFPEGIHRQAVEDLITGMGEEFYAFLLRQAETCDAEQTWPHCQQLCNSYLAVFSGSPRVPDVEKLQRRLRDKADLADLETKATELDKDYLAAQKLYRDYLKTHPDTTVKETLTTKIAALDKGANRQRAWKTVERYALNRSNSLARRVAKVRTFVDRNGKSPYIVEARALLENLSDQKRRADVKRQADESRRAAQARQAAEIQRLQRESQRIANLETHYQGLIARVAQRYRSNGNGTVLDKSTGKVWTLLDSTQMLGYCIDYAGAAAYVSNLNTGGYGDWRLPAPGELAGIYKSEPFFPLSSTQWYWSSESFIKGYNQGAYVVTGAHERIFNRESREASACGAVRAVRP